MIDHVSIGVRDLVAASAFYDAVLGALGMTRLRDQETTVGYGKRHPEFWLNVRDNLPPETFDTGVHVCLRTPTTDAVDAFHATGLKGGATDDGAPGLRPEYDPRYYAAFLKDPDGNRVEAVHFTDVPA
jgi:catechol 2,3-dioxygenase-like lactoylglutathione lyase family enzyme